MNDSLSWPEAFVVAVAILSFFGYLAFLVWRVTR